MYKKVVKITLLALLFNFALIEKTVADTYSGTSAYTPNFLGAMAETANAWKYDNLTMQEHYDDDVKFLGFVSGSFFEIFGATIYFDLADYYSSLHNVEISKEGCDHANPDDSDWVTVWVDVDFGLSIGLLPSNIGVIPIDISNYADPPRKLDVSILSASLPFCSLEGIGSTPQGYDWGLADWSVQANYSAGLISFGINVTRFEIKRDLLDQIVNGAFSSTGLISGSVLQGGIDKICDALIGLDNYMAMPSPPLLSSVRMFTYDDISVPEYKGAIGHISSGYDLDGKGLRVDHYMISPTLFGFPIIVLECDVTFQNTGNSTADYTIEVTNIPSGWYIGCVDEFNNPGDHRLDIEGVSPSSWTGEKWVATPWQIGVDKDAPDEATVTFTLYNEDTFLDSTDIKLHKFTDTFDEALIINGTSGSYQVGGIAQYFSREPGEPIHAGVTGTGSVWLKWIATNDGTVNFNTSESNYDTLLAVYTGTELNNLVEVASNNDYNGNAYSSVDFQVSRGTEYYIAIDTNGTLGPVVTQTAWPQINYEYTTIFFNGAGTSESPYQVYTRENLEAVNDDLAAHYILMNDIDLAGIEYDTAVIAPHNGSSDGFVGTKFTGNFNGNSKVIRNLTISANNSVDYDYYKGLFGYVNGGTIINLGIEGGSTSGGLIVCGLVGYNYYGSISNCYTTGDYSGDDYVSGLVAYNNAGSIDNCFATGDVNGNLCVGGLVGWISNGSITNSYSTGTVSGSKYVGGVAGYTLFGSTTNCHSTAFVAGGDIVGGLVGFNNGDTNIINNCYATGDVDCSGDKVGGLVGKNCGSISNCSADGSISGASFIGGLVGWNTSSGNITYCDATGDVSGSGDYTGGLVGVSDSGNISNCNSTGTVTATLSSSSKITVIAGGLIGKNWSNITNCNSTGTVTATTSSSSSNTAKAGGLIGSNSGSVTNCYSTGSVTATSFSSEYSAYAYAGGLIAENGDIVIDCYSTGIITASVSGNYRRTYAGGLIGRNYSNVSNCYATGTVSGTSNVGGLVGYNNSDSDSVSSCFSAGNVDGTFSVGGLIGKNISGSVSNSYSKSPVSGESDVGGLIGYITTGSITNSYSAGAVMGYSSDDFGGLVGTNESGSVDNSFWDTQTSDRTISAGGTGKTTIEMLNIDTFLNVGWNFTDIWQMAADRHPSFSWQDTYTVTFDLGDYGTRTGGGELVQTVEEGQYAILPTFEIAQWYKFTGWNSEHRNITSDRTIIAQYRHEITGDFNYDGNVNLLDFVVLADKWQSEYGMNDLLELSTNWLYIPLVSIEDDFETGDFTGLDWQLSGNTNWTIVSDEVFSGDFAAMSGDIDNGQQSILEVTVDTVSLNKISFYRKVSSESGWDYLTFYIDGIQQERWSGGQDWAMQTYTFTPGVHTFKWSYTKDASCCTGGSDRGWIDHVSIWKPKPIEIPNLAGMSRAAAESLIASEGLTLGTVTIEYSDTVAYGTVLSQNPAAGEWKSTGQIVDLVVSIDQSIEWVSIDNDPGFRGEMNKYETTNAQYCLFLKAAFTSGDITVGTDGNIYGAIGSNSGDDFEGEMYYDLMRSGRINNSGGVFTVESGFENHPVNYVKWHGATAFCNYYGWRLPTEWEWKAVADHTVEDPYTYGCGTSINNSIANYSGSIHPDGTSVVGSFGDPSGYGYGLCDMAGNVCEWASNRPYIEGRQCGILKGGSWNDSSSSCTVSARWRSNLDYVPDYKTGFRVCR